MLGPFSLYLYIQVAAVGLEYLFESVAGLQSARGQCKAVMRQFVECHLGFRGQLMIAVHNRGQIVLKQCMRHYAGHGPRWFESQHEIYLAFAQHGHQFGHGLVEHVEFDTGKILHECEDGLGEDRTERICNAYVERAGKHLLQVEHTHTALVGAAHGTNGKGYELPCRPR